MLIGLAESPVNCHEYFLVRPGEPLSFRFVVNRSRRAGLPRSASVLVSRGVRETFGNCPRVTSNWPIERNPV